MKISHSNPLSPLMRNENIETNIAQEYYEYAIVLFENQKKSFSEIKKALKDKGLDDASADIVVKKLANIVGTKKRSRAYRKIFIGGAFFIGGVILTLAEFGYIFWGAIVFGGSQFIHGFWKYLQIEETSTISEYNESADKYVLLEKFNLEDAANDFMKILVLDNIDFIIEDTSFSKDVFGSAGVTQEFLVKVNKQHYDRAVKFVQSYLVIEVQKIESDYYLFDFSNEELYELLATKHEWSRFDVLLAKKILKDRGL